MSASQRMTRAQIPMEEMVLTPGSTCQGCGAAMAARLTFKVLGPNLIRHGIPCCPDQVSLTPTTGSVFEGGGNALTGTSRALKASHVLTAMGVDTALAQGSILFSLGRESTAEDVDYVLELLPPIVDRLRQMSPLYGPQGAATCPPAPAPEEAEGVADGAGAWLGGFWLPSWPQPSARPRPMGPL